MRNLQLPAMIAMIRTGADPRVIAKAFGRTEESIRRTARQHGLKCHRLNRPRKTATQSRVVIYSQKKASPGCPHAFIPSMLMNALKWRPGDSLIGRVDGDGIRFVKEASTCP